MNEPALLELFNRLRQAGLPLGIGEYHILLRALYAGFGKENRDELAQLCCTLWIKSEEEEQIFQEYFDQLVPIQPEQNTILSLESDENIGELRHRQEIPSEFNLSYIKRQTWIIAFISSFALLGSFYLVRWVWDNRSSDSDIISFQTAPLSKHFGKVREDESTIIKVSRRRNSRENVSVRIIIDEADDKWNGRLLTPEYLKELDENTNKKTDDSTDEMNDILSSKRDFRENSVVVTFKEGQDKVQKCLIGSRVSTRNNCSLHIIDDEFNEGNEQVTLLLSDPQSKAILDTASLDIIDNDRSPIWPPIWLKSLRQSIMASAIILSLLIALKVWSNRQRINNPHENITKDYADLPRARLSQKVIQTVSDTVQVAKSIKTNGNQSNTGFSIIAKDLPINQRQMKQGWRYLRNFTREGIPIELDLEATIQQIGQQGFLLQPILTPRRVNKLEILILIDRDGSMVPFHYLSEELLQTALQGGRFNRVRAYYFRNCPFEYLYEDPCHLKTIPIEDCLSQLSKTRVVCLIFSDAGAARGGFNSRRRRRTRFFLKQLKRHVSHIAWLNPVPRPRWRDTTAAEIARMAPMFEATISELYGVIDTLRGRYQVRK